MKQLYVFLCAIVWKDLFKKRWAIIVELQAIPNIPKLVNNEFEHGGYTHKPCISRLPVKRPLTQPYNTFVKEHSRSKNLVITGSKRTLSNLGNVGSVLPHNFYYAEKGHKVTDNRDLNNLLVMATKIVNHSGK